MKKFELTSEFITNVLGTKLFRIKALVEFGDVSAGELGGVHRERGKPKPRWQRLGVWQR